MNIETRVATVIDAQFISLLGRVTFTETFGHLFSDSEDLLDYCTKTFSVSKIENSIKKSSNVFWITFVDRLPVAYAKLKLDSPSQFLHTNNICQLQKIYVLKDFLSLKIGFQLQTLLIQKAKELGYEKIWLSVLDSNERAIGFYKKNDFEEVGKHKFEIGKEEFNFLALGRKV